MKLYITLELQQNDPEHLKGSDLDEALESQLEDLEVDGWETKRVSIARESFTKQNKNQSDFCRSIIQQGRELAVLIRDQQGHLPFKGNPARTNTEVAAWTLHLLNSQGLI